MDGFKVLAFDTGGTILDWHGGITAALAECGRRRDVGRDWHELANEYRRRALRHSKNASFSPRCACSNAATGRSLSRTTIPAQHKIRPGARRSLP